MKSPMLSIFCTVTASLTIEVEENQPRGKGDDLQEMQGAACDVSLSY